MADTAGCAEVRELIPELAMGVASGEERAAALAHVAGCSECRERLAEATRVIDEMLLLAPAHEPPAGFDGRVLAALEPRRSRPRRRSALVLAAAVALLAAAAAAGITRWVDSDERQVAAQYRETLEVAGGSYLRAADLTGETGDEAGHVFAYQGSPSWIFMSVDSAEPGRYRVEVVTKDGLRQYAGECWVRDGRGSWGTAVDVPIRSIQAVVMSQPGAPTLTARFG